jgi:hypothetical protein
MKLPCASGSSLGHPVSNFLFSLPSRLCVLGSFSLLLLVLPPPSMAAREFEGIGILAEGFQEIPVDARIRGLASAGVALQPGAAAALSSPGALPLMETTAAVSFSRTNWLADLRVDCWSGAVQYGGVGLGLVWERLADKVPARSVLRPDGEPRDFQASDRMVIVAGGFDGFRLLRHYWPQLPQGLEWGFGLGRRSVKTTLADYKMSAWDLDLGSLLVIPLRRDAGEPRGACRLSDVSVQAGYAIRNLTDGHRTFFDDQVSLGRRDRAGLAVVTSACPHPRFGALLRSTLSYERQSFLVAIRRHFLSGTSKGERSVDRLGAELSLAGILSLRGGYAWDWRDPEYRHHRTWGVGLGLEPGNRILPRFGGRIDVARERSSRFNRGTDWAVSWCAKV